MKNLLLSVACLSLITLATAPDSRAESLFEIRDQKAELLEASAQSAEVAVPDSVDSAEPEVSQPNVSSNSDPSDSWRFSLEPYAFAALRV
ncbi:hypothetical protein VZH09_01210 [Synechococcus elongatus IITB7]|uniref:hypothetical protein n=1 Tax=Synechococcus elongatus TaxID=32046 RepID=UPI0030D4F923